MESIGPYKIVRRLGHGGMGAVYEAVHTEIKRRCAIKVLHPRFAGVDEINSRLLNEARAVNIVQHPSLVNIYEFGQNSDGSAYIVMEYLEGETLYSRIKKAHGPMDPVQTVRIARQIAAAVAAAHAKRIIHRDLKPGNGTPEGGRAEAFRG